MNIHLHAWTSLKHSFPIRKSEWVLSFMTLVLWLVFTLNTDLFQSSPGYAGMARWASQEFWGWMCFLIAAGRIAALIRNGAYWRSPHLRAGFAFLNCFVWYQLATGLAQNMGVGLAVFPGLLVLDAFNFRQAFMEAAASEGIRDGERGRLRVNN